MAIPLNPYVAGNPVGDSPASIGWANVLREVLRVLRRPQDNAIVLYGQRRIGKTSILQHLAAQLSFGGPYRPVYFDLQDKAAWPLGRVLQDLARTIAHSLSHIPVQSRFYMERLVRNMPDLELELRALAKQGFVAEDEAIPGGWRVRPGAFLWWLADELVRTVRDETPFEEWLQKQELGILLRRGEKQQLDKGVRAIVGLLKDGVATLIEAAAKGAGEAMFKGD